MWLVFFGGNFAPRCGIFVGDPAGGNFPSGMAGAERSVVVCVRMTTVLRWVKHVMSKMGDVSLSEFTSGGSIVFWHPRAWVMNVDIIRLGSGIVCQLQG